MRKFTITKIASYLIVLVMVFSLTAIFTVGASAEGTAQAQWGTDAANLTSSGTLQEAIDAAKNDSSITYIKVMSDIFLESTLNATGGAFTLDLNGKKIENTEFVLCVQNSTIITVTDTSAEQTGAILSTGSGAAAIYTLSDASAQITILGGELQGGYYAVKLSSNAISSTSTLIVKGGKLIGGQYAIGALGASVVITGGSLDGKIEDVDWSSGTLDLSNYANAANITIMNYTSADVTLPSENIMLPAGYSFYDENSDRVDDVLASNSAYTIDVTKYKVTVNVADNGSANTSADDAWVLSGTEVTVNTVPDDGYRISKIFVNGTPVEGSTFTMPDGDVIIDLTFRRYQAEWGTDKDTLTAWGSLQEALDAAATDANVKYIMVMRDHLIVEGGLCVTGGSFTLDLGGFTIESENYYTIDINNVNPVNLIITDTKGGGALIGPVPLKNWGGPANITLAGGTLQGENHAILIDFKNDASSLTVTGGVLQGGMYAITTCVNTTITGGILQGTACDLAWRDGTLDLAGHPNPVGITVDNETGLEQTLVLADGYNFYDEDGNKVVDGALASDTAYTVDVSKYSVTVNETENGSAAVDPSGYLAPGTVVTLVLTPNEGYKADVTVTGATFDPETNSFVVGNSDVTVDVTFKLYQAEWGTDKDTLTAWGTLEEAFDAAAAENSTIGYIKVVNNINMGSDYYWVEGGTFTLDLNGKTVTSAGHVLYLKNAVDITITDTSAEQTGKIESTDESSFAILVYDTSAIKLTIEGGTLSSAGIVIMAYSAFGEVLTVNLTIKGGTLQTTGNEHIWWGSTGVLDLSDYANPTGITVNNFSGAEAKIILPAGYSFYDENGNRVDGVFENVVYTIDETKYALDYVVESAAVSSEPAQGDLVPGTTVTFTVDLEELYKLISVSGMTASGTELEISYNEETGTYTFVMPEEDVEVVATFKHNAFVWGASADAMTSTGDFHDLVAAINAGNAPYAKLIDHHNPDLSVDDVTVSGKSYIDLGGYQLNLENSYQSRIILANGADITLFADQKIDDTDIDNANVYGCFELQSGSKLTLSGVRADAEVFFSGGALDISGAHLLSVIEVWNEGESTVTLADLINYGAYFRAIDFYTEWEDYTIPGVTELEVGESADICAVFKISFDFGKGSGTQDPVEILFDYAVRLPKVSDATHPDGLALVGWSYEDSPYEIFAVNGMNFWFPCLSDITLVAEWGAPIYVGGVGMNDGDYLASGAAETTKSRPTTGGYAYYKNGVLTLNNYQFSGDGFVIWNHSEYMADTEYALIYSTTDLVIELVGSSNLVGTAIQYDGEYDAFLDADTDGIRVMGDLSIRGKGSLNIKVEDDGLYIVDLIFESGTVTIISDDEAIESDSITILNGVLITVSEDGVDSEVVTVKGGEFHVLPEDDEDDVEFATQTLIVTGGKLVVKGCYGIYADYVTISGGVVEVEAEEADAISSWNSDNEDGFVTISGGKVTIRSEYGDAIYSTGDVTISGGEIKLNNDCCGIYANNVTVTGGKLTITGGDAIYGDCNVTITGGDIEIYDGYNGICVSGNVTISGGNLYIDAAGNSAIEIYGDEYKLTINGGFIELYGNIEVAETITVTFGGKATQLYIEGEIVSTNPLVLTEGEIKHILTLEGANYYEGVEVSHTWTDAYKADETHHYHVCVDEDCIVRYLDLSHSYYQYFEDADYGEHTIPEGESTCSVCGYGTEITPEAAPEGAVLIVGDLYLKSGEYLTFDLDGKPIVVTEKPATGGYLYATVDTTGEYPSGTIVLSNFNFEYTGGAAIVTLTGYAWMIEIEGDNTITAYADKNYSALYEDFLINGAGIATISNRISIVGEGSLTINAEVGIFGYSSFFTVESGATVIINAQQGVEMSNGIFCVENATLIVNSKEDGICICEGALILRSASKVSVIAGDDGLVLDSVTFHAINATVTVVAVDDAIDAGSCYIEWENSSFNLTADDRAISIFAETQDHCSFFVKNSILNIEAGDDGIRIYNCSEVFFVDSVINIAAEDAGLYLENTQVAFASEFGTILSLSSTPGTFGNASEVNINAKRNYLCDTAVEFYDTKLNVEAIENAFELDYAELEFMNSEISILSRDVGIYGEYESYVDVYDSVLSIEAARYGISGDLYLYLSGDLVDVGVRAFKAIYCEGVYFNEDDDFMMNAYCDDYTFWNENDEIASYVTVRGYEAVSMEMEKAIEQLDQLISEGGEFDAIAEEITALNAALEILREESKNADAALKEELSATILAAQETLNKAIQKVAEDLASAKEALQGAIENGDVALDAKITELNNKLLAAEEAYKVADGAVKDELNGKIIAAQTTLDTAIKALAEKVSSAETTIAEHEQAIAQLQAALEALQQANENNKNLKDDVEEMEVELTEADQKNQIAQTVTAVVAGTSLTCNVALAAAAIILERKKGLLTSLFSGIFKK